MKKLAILLAAAAMTFAAVEATTLTASDNSVVSMERVKISPSELPDAVKTSISNNFNGWNIDEAFMETETREYEVKLSHEGESKTVMFDKDGNIIS